MWMIEGQQQDERPGVYYKLTKKVIVMQSERSGAHQVLRKTHNYISHCA